MPGEIVAWSCETESELKAKANSDLWEEFCRHWDYTLCRPWLNKEARGWVSMSHILKSCQDGQNFTWNCDNVMYWVLSISVIACLHLTHGTLWLLTSTKSLSWQIFKLLNPKYSERVHHHHQQPELRLLCTRAVKNNSHTKWQTLSDWRETMQSRFMMTSEPKVCDIQLKAGHTLSLTCCPFYFWIRATTADC